MVDGDARRVDLGLIDVGVSHDVTPEESKADVDRGLQLSDVACEVGHVVNVPVYILPQVLTRSFVEKSSRNTQIK